MGSKEGAGTLQQLLGLLMPHSVYVECFLGNGAVLRHKTPALRTIGVEADAVIVKAWERTRWPGVELVHADAIAWLAKASAWLPPDALVYCDPPYPHNTRTSSKRYRHELSGRDHRRLLDVLDALECSVIISSYESRLYLERLGDRRWPTWGRSWRHHSWPAMTRGGLRTEHAWVKTSMAAASVSLGVEARYLGQNFRDRTRIKRKVARWTGKFDTMPVRDRTAILAALLTRYEASSVRPGANAAASVRNGVGIRRRLQRQP